jgi:hypothetical protein
MTATSACAAIANAERATSINSGPRHVSVPVFSRRTSAASSIAPIISASGRRLPRLTVTVHLPLERFLFGDIGQTWHPELT